MNRLTRKFDKYPCRFKGGCPAEDWIMELTDTSPLNWKEFICKSCPFMLYINELANYEDLKERMEDDLK